MAATILGTLTYRIAGSNGSSRISIVESARDPQKQATEEEREVGLSAVIDAINDLVDVGAYEIEWEPTASAVALRSAAG